MMRFTLKFTRGKTKTPDYCGQVSKKSVSGTIPGFKNSFYTQLNVPKILAEHFLFSLDSEHFLFSLESEHSLK